MRKNILILSMFLLLYSLISPFNVQGHMMDSNDNKGENTINKKTCSQPNSYYETQGDEFMEKIMGKEQDKIMEQRIGKELSKEMRLHMGKTLAGCENNQFMTKMFSMMSLGKTIDPNSIASNNFGMGMNNWGFNLMGLFIGLTILLFLTFLILGIIYFLKEIKKKKK